MLWPCQVKRCHQAAMLSALTAGAGPPAGAPLFNNTMFCHNSSCYFYRSTAADYYTAREACADIGAGVGDLVVYGTEAEHWRVERYMYVKVRQGLLGSRGRCCVQCVSRWGGALLGRQAGCVPAAAAPSCPRHALVCLLACQHDSASCSMPVLAGSLGGGKPQPAACMT